MASTNGVSQRINALVGGPVGRRLASWGPLVPRIASFEEEFQGLGDYELRKKSLSLRYRARSGESLGSLLVEAYALVREAARRTLGMRHFDV